jgi:hypothetical protein
MRSTNAWWAFAVSGIVVACGDDDDGKGSVMDASITDASTKDASTQDATVSANFSFFVTSDTSTTANLGGLHSADQRCQRLAAAVGAAGKTWRAFLSVERDATNSNQPAHARDRIGDGPWYNARGALIANDIAGLLARPGDAELFLDERGTKINGQWTGSPKPNEHDILTGSNVEGRVLAAKTCGDWTLGDATFADGGVAAAQVGHSDGLGPSQNSAPPYNSWHSSHESASCQDLVARGGTGRIYCFARD